MGALKDKVLDELYKNNYRDLYNLKEQEVIDIIQKSIYKDAFNKWKKAEKVLINEEKPNGVYAVNLVSKIN